MATCPNCGTENKEGTVACVECGQPLPKKLRKLKKLKKVGSERPARSPQKKVVERVPEWLQLLLAKYGEAPGLLVGLEEVEEPESFEHLPTAPGPRPVSDETAAEVTALLEQMADEGVDGFTDEGTTTSVEWGSYAPDEQ